VEQLLREEEGKVRRLEQRLAAEQAKASAGEKDVNKLRGSKGRNGLSDDDNDNGERQNGGTDSVPVKKRVFTII